MTEEQKSNQEYLNEEASNESTGKFKMPWNNKFGEDENLKNRQYSRTARNQPAREATTLSKVLLFLIVCACLIPFILYIWVNATKGNQQVTPKTASQVAISRAENSSVASVSSSEASSSVESAASVTSSVTANSVSSVVSTSEVTTRETGQENQAATQETQQQQTQQQQQPQQQQGGTSYVVQAGDSWYGIATRHGVDVYALAAANGATIDSTILPGQTIIIP